MFSRKSCYFFVRPKKSHLEVCVFLGRALKAPQVRRADRASKSKVVHFIHIRHRDEVEAPITDWLHEAYEFSDALASTASAKATAVRQSPGEGGSTARWRQVGKKPARKSGAPRGSRSGGNGPRSPGENRSTKPSYGPRKCGGR
jgi:Domain of unknown function (DUF5655)